MKIKIILEDLVRDFNNPSLVSSMILFANKCINDNVTLNILKKVIT